MHPRCHQSPPITARPFSEVQHQFCGSGGYPGRADRRQGLALRAPHSELTTASRFPEQGCLPTGLSSEEAVMKYAPIQVLPDDPSGGVVAGIDWATADHEVCVVDMAGRVSGRFSAAHDKAGIGALILRLRESGVAEVAIERGDGALVEALLAAGLTVVVITSRQVKNLRSRYRSAGAKDDRFDAFVLADTLRTDRARLRPLTPNSPQTAALRALCRTRRDLVIHRVAVANQLREHLNRVFPGAVGLFTKLDSPISLRFLARFDCQDRADWLTPRRLESWLKSMGYCGRTDPAAVYARLSAAPRGLCADAGAAPVPITRALVAALGSLVEQITMLSDQIGQQLEAHADSHIFTSLPHAGTVRAARLLAEIGDCRARFPTPESLACLAGVAPSTRQSGKMRSVGFRWACDKQLRDAVCDFADGSRRANPWAAQLYGRARARGHDHPHAVRVLARAWVYIIWACWQTNTAYDP